MKNKLKRKIKPTSLLLVIGFSISLTAVIIGISAIDGLLQELNKTQSDIPIFDMMQNTGLSLAGAVYLFSTANCFIVTHYWIVTKRREFAIRKAFGWTNRQLLGIICKETAGLLCVSIGISSVLITIAENEKIGFFKIEPTPFFIIGTLGLLLVTMILASIVPAVQISKIQPAEVVS